MWFRLVLVLLAASPASAALSAQEPLALPRLTGPIELDGFSDEPAWEAVEPLPLSVQIPTFGEAPSERTEFRIAYDDQYLYAAGRLYDSDPRGIQVSSLKRDDGSFSNDWFAINLDTFLDRENVLVVGTNPAGVRTDAVFVNDAQGPPNFNWNTFWDSAVRQTDEGWFAEIRVPLSSLRFQEKDGRVVMGLTVWRLIARKNEMITFPAIPPSWGTFSVFKASQAREVVLEGVRRRNPVYLTPYLLGGAGRAHALNPARTAYIGQGQSVREAGLDLKYGVTSNLTLDMTYNTDFAQVEADDQQVNLTRFSLFFPEKRLFFQERASIFDFSLGQNDRLFYSRRIGLSNGQQIPIHGGARLVGRVGGWDVGLLGMQSESFQALPSESFGVLRLRRQLWNQSSYVGAIATGRAGGGMQNGTYGLDGIFRLFGQDFLTLQWAQSQGGTDDGSPGGLDRSLARARWERRGIDGFTYALDATRSGSHFDPSMGFLLRRNFTRLGDRVAYGWRPGPESPILHHTLALNATAYRRNGDGSLESFSVGPEWKVDARSGHSLTLGATAQLEDLEGEFRMSSGASVPAGTYRFHGISAAYRPPNGALFRPELGVEGGSFYDGWQATGRVSPIWNVSRHLELSGLYQASRVELPERDQRLDVQVARLRARAMVNTRLSVAGFVQYSSAVDGLFANLRVRFNPREGDDLYLVYNAGWNTDRFGFAPARPLLDNHAFMLKYSRTLGIGF